MKYAHVMLEFGKVRIEIRDMYVFCMKRDDHKLKKKTK